MQESKGPFPPANISRSRKKRTVYVFGAQSMTTAKEGKGVDVSTIRQEGTGTRVGILANER